MKNTLANKVYEFVNHVLYGSGNKLAFGDQLPSHKKCPVTGLDISMQPNTSKFLSLTGVKWYYEHKRKIYDAVLAPRLTGHFSKAEPSVQFREISHSIRNSDSNPRNNSKRAIQKVLSEKDCLFNNLELIDKEKLKEAGISATTYK